MAGCDTVPRLLLCHYKKGDKNDPSNYRGITLCNITSKIFSLLLRNRLNRWSENNDVFSDCQFGFRDNHSTTDAIFILHSVIQKVLSKQAKLWCVFIDYQRAFDSVNREALWYKLIQSGISCKMINMIKCMYGKVQSCVKLSSVNISDFFDVTIGLKQGEPLSPILFLFFLNDIIDNLDFNSLADSDLELLSKYLILFADDIVLFTTNPESLQAQIDSIYQYSVKWGLTINVNKTKVCIFEKRKSNHDQRFYINNEIVEIVDSFVYLGIKFNHLGTFTDAVKCLHNQALKAYSNLQYLFDKVRLDIKTKLALFDSMIVPILTYGAEVWGVYNLKDVDKLHLRFCKHLLGVKKQTPNSAVYGELGRFPLSLVCKERAINYWYKIMSNVDKPIYFTFLEQCNIANSTCWAKRIHSIIDHLGLSHFHFNFNRAFNCVDTIKRRLRDQFIQDWNASINSMSKLDAYCKFKKNFCFEEYLVKIADEKHRKVFTRFRMCSHDLEIEAGRFNRIQRENRSCRLCTQHMVENEYHFLMCCPKYSEIRRKYLGNIQWPNKNKFNNLMASSSRKTLLNISRYIKDSLLLRKNTLVTIAAL